VQQQYILRNTYKNSITNNCNALHTNIYLHIFPLLYIRDAGLLVT